MNPPAFQFYADDFLGGTADMTTEEVGAYIRLLCHAWNKGGLPDDDARLLRMAGLTQALSLGFVKSKFKLLDGLLKNERMELERAKQQAFRRKQAENGAKGGRPVNPSLTQRLSQTKAKKSSPSPSPPPVVPPTPTGGLNGWTPNPEQERLGALFNRRPQTVWSGKELKAWKEITPIREEDMSALEKYYSTKIPEASDFRRHDLSTLLNNFNGEVDRARNFKPPKPF